MNMSSNTEQTVPIQINEEEIKRLNQEMITSDLITPDKLYLDLALFKDFNIGTILSFLKDKNATLSEEEYSELYKKIIEKIPEYNERKFDDLEHIFPFMGVTNEQIKDRKNDPQYASFIFHTAPVTKYIEILKAQIAVNINHSAVIGKRDPIELTINTYPLQLTEADKTIVGIFFSTTYSVNVKTIYLDMKTVKLSDIISFDEIYTYFFKEIFDCEAIRQAYTELKFIGKRLYVTKLFGEKTIPTKNTDQEALYIQSRLDILTTFKFVPPPLFSAPPPIIRKEITPHG